MLFRSGYNVLLYPGIPGGNFYADDSAVFQGRTEFLNRVDDIIMFKSLDKEEIKKIIDIFMNSLSNRLKDKDINMEVTDAAKDIMVREGYDPVYGARPLKRYIGNTLETIIARKLIAGQIRNGDTIVVDGDGDNIDIVVK